MSNFKFLHNYYYIYKIVNLINKKCYVGFHASNKEFDKDTYFGSGKILKNAIKKHGRENFLIGIIEYIEPEEWQEKEMFWIKEMKSHISQWGYNLTWGGDGRLGFKHTEKTKKHWSKIRKGRPSTFKGHHLYEEAKNKISLTNKNNQYRLGKIHTLETKQKIGFKNSIKLKNNKNALGLKHSINTKLIISKRMSGKNNPMYGISPDKIECIYCHRFIDKRNYSRWHDKKCKNYHE
jgi:group I intron endonuclease